MSKPVLIFHNVTIGFRGREIVSGVSFAVQEGECVLLQGVNGAGKTSILRCGLGLLSPLSGTVQRVTNNIAYVPQVSVVANTLPITAHEVVEMGVRNGTRSERNESSSRALERVGLRAEMHRQFFDLSGGQQQRVLLARALCGDPELLFLDEPTSAVDAAAERELVELLRSLQSELKLSMLIVTHNVEVFADLQPRVCSVADGGVHVE